MNEDGEDYHSNVVLTATVNISGETIEIKDIYVGEEKLATTDYAILGDEITIYKTVFSDLEIGEHIIEIESENHGSVFVTLTVIDTEVEE